MSEPNRKSPPAPHIPLEAKPALSAKELADAVLNASEAVARASAGDVAGSVKAGASAVKTVTAPSAEVEETQPAPVQSEPAEIETAQPELQTAAMMAQPETPPSAPVDAVPDEEKEEEEKKKPGLGPRWSYIITRGLVVACVWAFFAFAFDPLIRFGAVQSAQAVVGAKVDVEEFSTQFFPPRLNIAGVAVANRDKPGTNLVEFGKIEGEVDGLALMKKSYILHKATITDLRWGTKRKDSGLLDESEEEAAKDEESELLNKLEQAGKEWADGLLDRAAMKYDPRNLETYVLADQLEDEWKTDFDDLEGRVKDVEVKAKKLKELFDGAKRDPLRNLPKIDQIVKEGLRLKGDLREIRTDVARLPPKAQLDVTALNDARRRDTDRIQREVKELILDEDKLSEFLLGPELHHKVTQAVSWLQWTDDRVERVRTTKPKRTRGEDIPFTDRNPLPRFLARLIDVKGDGEIAGDHLEIQGTISDVTNDPVLHGKPTIVRIEGTGEASVKLHATLDRTKEVPSNELNLSYTLPHATDDALGDDDTFAIVVHAASTEWTANLRTLDQDLSGTIVLRQKPVRLEARLKEGADDRLREVVESAIAGIDEVQATVTLFGTVKDPKWKLRTTLGRQISRGVQRGMNSVLSAEKDKLVAKLDGELQGRQQEFLGKLNGRYGEITELLKLNDTILNELDTTNLIQRVKGTRFDPRRIFNR